MSSMKPEVLREASIEIVPSDKILSDPSLVLHLDLKTCHVQETEFFTAFRLTMTRQDQLTALVGSFDVTFQLDHTVALCTSPYDPPTHWKQTVFYLPQPISVQKGRRKLSSFLYYGILNVKKKLFFFLQVKYLYAVLKCVVTSNLHEVWK